MSEVGRWKKKAKDAEQREKALRQTIDVQSQMLVVAATDLELTESVACGFAFDLGMRAGGDWPEFAANEAGVAYATAYAELEKAAEATRERLAKREAA